MKNQKTLMMVVALVMICFTGAGLYLLKNFQKLGKPGIKTSVIPGSQRVDIYLPTKVLNYNSQIIPTDTNVLNGLPQDTSFMQRRYVDMRNTNWVLMNVVLMGKDRTSIHKPEFCLTGSGWNIDGAKSDSDVVHVSQPAPYDLPVMKLTASREAIYQGQTIHLSGIYVYWFVADQDLTESHSERMWRTAKRLLTTGELERWAYVSCFDVCLPGREQQTYERMKQFIAASVPEFQLATGPRPGAAAAPAQRAAN